MRDLVVALADVCLDVQAFPGRKLPQLMQQLWPAVQSAFSQDEGARTRRERGIERRRTERERENRERGAGRGGEGGREGE